MVRVKSEADIRANYEKSTADVGRRFEIGVKTAEWNAPALEGQALYEEQMSRAEVLQRRAKGISNVSDTEWRNNTINKGKNIIGARMKESASKQLDGYRPYRNLIEGISLPPKVASVEQNVLSRCLPIAQAQRDLKEQIKG